MESLGELLSISVGKVLRLDLDKYLLKMEELQLILP